MLVCFLPNILRLNKLKSTLWPGQILQQISHKLHLWTFILGTTYPLLSLLTSVIASFGQKAAQIPQLVHNSFRTTHEILGINKSTSFQIYYAIQNKYWIEIGDIITISSFELNIFCTFMNLSLKT